MTRQRPAAGAASLPSLVVSDTRGNLFDIPDYAMAVRLGDRIAAPRRQEIIPLPPGSDLHLLPGRAPVGIDRRTGEPRVLRTWQGRRVLAASAFVSPAHALLGLAAFHRRPSARPLPLFAYAPLGFDGRDFVTTAVRVDRDRRQDAEQFDQEEIVRRGTRYLERNPANRLTSHLIWNCAFTYHCPAARNWVMGRWEAPVPTSVSCNAACLGCISKQPEASDVPSTQERLVFVPSVAEILAYTVPHLEHAPRAVVSFGQGCEGEPLTQADLIADAVRNMRKRTDRGTINLNTNASRPGDVERICRAGLDSMRVSLNSAREPLYRAYVRPKGYGFDDVLASIRAAKKLGVWVSLNYFILPGLTDTPREMDALRALLGGMDIDMIQMRNHNIDPDWYADLVRGADGGGEPAGILRWMKEMRKARPGLRFGYYNPWLGGRSGRR